MSTTTKLKAVKKLATKRAGEYNLQPGYREQSPAPPIRAHTNADR